MSTEHEWATALTKARREVVQRRQIPISIRKNQIDSQIKISKQQLRTACLEHNRDHVSQLLETLIELRATQTALFFEDMKEQYGTIGSAIIRQQTKAYVTDCLHLIQSAQTLGKP